MSARNLHIRSSHHRRGRSCGSLNLADPDLRPRFPANQAGPPSTERGCHAAGLPRVAGLGWQPGDRGGERRAGPRRRDGRPKNRLLSVCRKGRVPWYGCSTLLVIAPVLVATANPLLTSGLLCPIPQMLELKRMLRLKSRRASSSPRPSQIRSSAETNLEPTICSRSSDTVRPQGRSTCRPAWWSWNPSCHDLSCAYSLPPDDAGGQPPLTKATF